jgi:hypothetical protein
MTDIFGDLKMEKKKHPVERALFFCMDDLTYLLHAVGPTIESDLEAGLVRDGEAGPWDQTPNEDGLWIWEGIPGWNSGYTFEYGDEGGEPNYDTGKVRRPTPEELQLITNGPMEKLFGPPMLGAGDLELPDGAA